MNHTFRLLRKDSSSAPRLPWPSPLELSSKVKTLQTARGQGVFELQAIAKGWDYGARFNVRDSISPGFYFPRLSPESGNNSCLQGPAGPWQSLRRGPQQAATLDPSERWGAVMTLDGETLHPPAPAQHRHAGAPGRSQPVPEVPRAWARRSSCVSMGTGEPRGGEGLTLSRPRSPCPGSGVIVMSDHTGLREGSLR